MQQALQRYHTAREESESPQDHFAAMNDFHRSIYRWFDAVKRPGLHKEESAPPNLELMKRVLAETDQEHAALVKGARRSGALPIDTRGMQKKEIDEVTKLWSSIRQQQGNLKVQGSKDFKNRQYANLARLIQGKEGRSLVGEVDRRFNWGNKTVTIGEDFANHPALQGVQQNPGSYTAATDDTSSRILNWNRRSLLDTASRYFGKAQRSDQLAPQLEKSVRGGESGVWTPDKRLLRFNWGSNALLRMTQAPEGQSDLIDRDEKNIINPEFVTLGHELGHALRIQRGARLDKLGGGQGGLEDLGVTDEEAKKRWTDPEEYVNITQTENPIRREHGISERSYHVGSDVLEARQRWKVLREELAERDGKLDQSLDKIEKHPKTKDGVKKIRGALTRLLQKQTAPQEHDLDIRNPQHHNSLREEMADLEHQGEELHLLAKEDK